jgi:hypothetical protein
MSASIADFAAEMASAGDLPLTAHEADMANVDRGGRRAGAIIKFVPVRIDARAKLLHH